MCPEQTGNEVDLGICHIKYGAAGDIVAWSVHVAVARQPVYIPVCAVCAPRVDTFQNRREIRMALLMYCGISVYDMITSRTMRVIWDVY